MNFENFCKDRMLNPRNLVKCMQEFFSVSKIDRTSDQTAWITQKKNAFINFNDFPDTTKDNSRKNAISLTAALFKRERNLFRCWFEM